MKNILACSNFSDGMQVATTAVDMAGKIKGNVYVLKISAENTCVHDRPVTSGEKVTLSEEVSKSGEVEFQGVVEEALAADVALTYAGENLDQLKECNCDKIDLVITCEDEDSVNPAAKFKNLGCPVLKLPKRATLQPPARIAYITDLRYFDAGLFASFLDLFGVYEPELIITHLTASGLPEIQNDYAELLFSEQIVPWLGYNKYSLINLPGHYTIHEMDNVMEVLKPDMLVLGSRIHGYYERLFSTTGVQGAYSQLPLVLFN